MLHCLFGEHTYDFVDNVQSLRHSSCSFIQGNLPIIEHHHFSAQLTAHSLQTQSRARAAHHWTCFIRCVSQHHLCEPDCLIPLKCRHGDWSERSMFYLKREVEQTVETWEKLVVAGDEHELAVFIGTEILRLRKVEEVRC